MSVVSIASVAHVLPLDACAESNAFLRPIFRTDPVSENRWQVSPKIASSGRSFKIAGSLVHCARQLHLAGGHGFRRDHERSIRGAANPAEDTGSRPAPAWQWARRGPIDDHRSCRTHGCNELMERSDGPIDKRSHLLVATRAKEVEHISTAKLAPVRVRLVRRLLLALPQFDEYRFCASRDVA